MNVLAKVTEPANPAPLSSLYREVWKNTAYRRYAPGECYVDVALEALRPSLGASFIDFGCGTGRPAWELRKRGYGVVGVDFAENCLDENVEIPFLLADLTTQLSLTAEYGFCTDVMEHVEAVDDVLLTIATAVKKAVFFSIALDVDEFGPSLVGKPLHLTVKSAAWWKEKLETFWPRVEIITETATLMSAACFSWPPKFREDVRIEALCNTPDEVIERYVRINGARGLPFVRVGDGHQSPIIVAGGGPSLARELPRLTMLKGSGCKIVALNGAADFLHSKGMAVDCQLLIDSRPENVRFVASKVADEYLLSAQCHPDLFDALKDEKVTIFYPALGKERMDDPKKQDRTRELLPVETEASPLIGGAITSGMQALSVIYALGYRRMFLFGYDSSDDDDGTSHAYPQEESAAEKKRLDVQFKGRVYRSSFAMYKQAEEFPAFAKMLADNGAELFVCGDGLLPAMARDMSAPEDPGRACYMLAGAPASYDFICWLVIAEMTRRRHGVPAPLKVAFKQEVRRNGQDLPLPDSRQMLDHVMRPALALVGAVEDDSALEAASLWHNRYTAGPIVEAVRDGEEVPRFAAPEEYRRAVDRWLREYGIEVAPLVITLREASHWPERNSDVEAWERFALEQDRPVIFVRDTAKADEHIAGCRICPEASKNLLVRMALYERAACNFFVANGPATLTWFSDRPWLQFYPLVEGYPPSTDAWLRKNHGFGRGEQVPWARPDQRIIWERDDYETIRSAWDELRPLLA